jgi:hypothetical protein
MWYGTLKRMDGWNLMNRRTFGRLAVQLLGGSVFLCALFVWYSTPVAASGRTVAASGPVVQATPTVDVTVTALQKEQLVQQIEQLKEQNSWSAWTNLATPLSILVGLLTVLGGVWRYLRDQRSERAKQREVEKQQLADRQVEREKQAEERFQKVVEGLGSANEASQVGAAIMLRTFLSEGKDYEQFYSQAFDLAVAHLRLRNIDPQAPDALTSLSQALVTVLKESYPLARDRLKQHPRYLDASHIQLDRAYLSSADLRSVWIPKSSLRKATLRSADLSRANMNGVDLDRPNLSGANLTGVKDWTDAKLHYVKGLTQAQLEACHARGAIIDPSRASHDEIPHADASTMRH